MIKVHNNTDRGSFQPAAWTKILNAQKGSETTLVQVMNHLISLYWKPVYFHIIRKGKNVEDAKDLTQQFFAIFMERGALMTVDPARGKFRTFLLVCVNNFLSDEYDKSIALKRIPNLDFEESQPHFFEENNFERDWAIVVLDRAFSRLKEQSPREAKVVEAQRGGKTSYKELALEMGLSESNIKVLAHRGRSKLKAIILEELKETISEPGSEKEELTALFKALS